jgi:hypothetical protein
MTLPSSEIASPGLTSHSSDSETVKEVCYVLIDGQICLTRHHGHSAEALVLSLFRVAVYGIIGMGSLDLSVALTCSCAVPLRE